MVYSQGKGDYAPSWLELEKASGGRAILGGSPEEIRGMYAALGAALAAQMPPPSENVESKDGDVDGIKYRTYWPKGTTEALPIAFYTHGGGYMVGGLDDDDFLCRVISEHTKSALIAVDYRLTPEHKWPTQLDDSMKIYKWAHMNASSFHGDSSKIYTIGGSAGGGLALQVANQVLRDSELKSSLKGIIALVPLTLHKDHVPEKYKDMYTSYKDNAKGTPIIDGESMEIFYEHAGVDPKDPDTFVALSDNLKSFPPTYIATCEFDPLRDDGFVLEAALKEAGVPTKHDHYPGFPHYFWIFPSVPESQQFVGQLLGGIEWAKSKM
ncbi:Telomerase-binding protein [Elasticomyces elasticus]|uniref:Telomerase-binding protein n=1 Tax=Elasticomyces elasticus TaxID=574655 RepID=A0AAN8A6F2_9PEZI|nr:Telomerase-binding protein [Elasticomyces elasticus]